MSDKQQKQQQTSDYFTLFYSSSQHTDVNLLMSFFNKLYTFFCAYCIYVYNQIYQRKIESSEKPEKIEKPKSLDVQFIEKEKQIFMRCFQDIEQKGWNTNMDSEFYDMEKYKAMMAEENNVLEKKWKSKILLEQTPRGNIIMFYDAFKKGFSYYCDMQGIPYNILNACAMKYVRTYNCLDLFLDEREVPEDYTCVLIKVQEEEEKAEKERLKKENKIIEVPKMKKDGPFAKLKNYKLEEKAGATKTDKTDQSEKKKMPAKEISVNKFINLGKTNNFSFLQKIPKKSPIPMNNHGFQQIFSESNKLQRDLMSYSDFKKSMIR